MSKNAADADADEELRYWLANEDWYMSQTTRRWLEHTPPVEARDTLARIAEDADLDTRTPFIQMITLIAVAGFSPSGAIAGSGPGRRKAGIRAALMLANLGDARALAPLGRVYAASGAGHAYQSLIEPALRQALEAATAPPGAAAAPGHAPAAVRELTERLWHAHNGRQDIDDGRTAVLEAALGFLRAVGGPENEAAVRAVAEGAASVGERMPNRARVREAARGIGQAP